MAREFLDMESLEKSVYNKQSKRTTIYYADIFYENLNDCLKCCNRF